MKIQGSRSEKRRRRRLLAQSFKLAGADKIIASYILVFFFCAFLIWLLEPSIQSYPDSLWYCFAAATTVGFGDLTAVTMLGRIITVLLTIYSIAVTAIFTAVITNFFLNVAKVRASDSASAFLADLERLPDMSKEELTELSKKARRFAKKDR